MPKILLINAVIIVSLFTLRLPVQQNQSLADNVKQAILVIQPDMQGIFFEDINGADGGKPGSKGKLTVMESDKLAAFNSLDNPKTISPFEEAINVKGNKVNLNLTPYSFTVVRVKMS